MSEAMDAPAVRYGGDAELLTPDFFDDPYPTYAAWRATAPVVRLGQTGEHVAVGFDAVYDILRNHEVFSSHGPRGYAGERDGESAVSPLRMVLITDDPPRHTRFRNLVNRAFTPRRVAELEPVIRDVVEERLAGFGAGEVDLMAALAVPLPMTMIARLLGVPQRDGDRFKKWSTAIIATSNGQADQAALFEMVPYLNAEVAKRRAEPVDDLIGALTAAEIDGERLRDWEVLGFTVLLLVAGNETTTNLIGNMLSLLARDPALWARLRADRSLVEPVIEESLRLDSPVQILNRWAVADTEAGGVRIPAHASLSVAFGAANRDPAAFEAPAEFRLGRPADHRHLAFGIGVHYCLGSPLARLEAKVALDALLDRYERVEPRDGATRQRRSYIVRGFTHLPLAFA